MKPFIHKFKTENRHYIYDVNSNRTFEVSPVVFDLCDKPGDSDSTGLAKAFPQHSREQLETAVKELAEAKTDGFLSSERPERMAFPGGEDIEELIKKYPHEQLILGITERCNLRCKYCIYSGNYAGQRTHGKQDMSFECAKTAIDKFLANAQNNAYISFYGGEPLIVFPLIRKIIDYTESILPAGKTITWSMTTNGTLLKPDICDYLYQKGFILTVSLDGPEEIHDRYRVYKNGRGSHQTILKSLHYLYTKDPNYYRKNVLFSVVSAPPFNFQQVSAYFATHELLKANNISFSFMNYSIKEPLRESSPEDYIHLNQERQLFSEQYIRNIASGKRNNTFGSGLYEKEAIAFYHRPKVNLGKTIRLNGCCIPGIRRIFVSTQGILHICEKIDNTLPIGTVEKWVDPVLVKEIIDNYIDMSNDCFNCWANRLCTRCFASFIEGTEFSPQIRITECETTRRQLHKMLYRYYSIYESNPAALDYLADINLS